MGNISLDNLDNIIKNNLQKINSGIQAEELIGYADACFCVGMIDMYFCVSNKSVPEAQCLRMQKKRSWPSQRKFPDPSPMYPKRHLCV